jgi:hypothetical protein
MLEIRSAMIRTTPKAMPTTHFINTKAFSSVPTIHQFIDSSTRSFFIIRFFILFLLDFGPKIEEQ